MLKKILNIKYSVFILLILFIVSCSNEEVEYQQNNCKRMPIFVQKMGYPVNASFFSTTDERRMGLLLKQSSQANNPNAQIVKEYQHPSWQKGGWLAPIVLDEQGNIFVAPAPFINMLNNPNSNRNTIYKIDTKTGEMNEWLKLPTPDSTIQNPFGIIGMIYLCETKTLYVSTLAGSDRQNERGGIYAINTESKKIEDKITGVDAMGMGISYIEGKRKLYYGTGRSSDIFSITLSNKGTFSSSSEKVFTIQNLGVRGDDKVRRIFTNANGNLIVAGFEFNYNLIAPREKQETQYTFQYDEEEKKWEYNQ